MVIGIAASAPSFAQEQVTRLTLIEALKLGLKHQPSLAVSTAGKQAAAESLKQARASYLPTLSAQYSYQDNRQSKTTPLQTYSRNGDVVLSYTLLDSGKRLATEQQAKAAFHSAEYAESDQRQTVIYSIASAYYTVLRTSELVKVSQANVERAQVAYDLAVEQAKQGAAAEKDTFQADADLQNAKVSLLSAQNDADIAQTQLKQAVGLEEADRVEAAPVVESAEQEPLDGMGNLLKVAYAKRPDVLEANQTVEQYKASVRLAQAINGPTLAVEGSLTGAFAPASDTSRALALTVSVPLFDGGSRRAAVSQAQANQRSAEAQLKSTRLSVAVDVEQAYRNLTKARASVPASVSAEKAAQVAYDAALESRKENLGTVVDVINARAQLVQAQTNRVNAQFDLLTAEAQLKRAIGSADVILEKAQGGAQ